MIDKIQFHEYSIIYIFIIEEDLIGNEVSINFD